MSTATLNGRVIGLAHHATRAVLERELARHGVSFPQSVALTAVADAGGVMSRSGLVGRITGGLKIDEWAAATTLTELTDAALVEALPGHQVGLTEAGRALRGRIADAVAGITARLYADIPADDLAVAARVLTRVTERADAALAAATDQGAGS
ncbi:MarR family winged helix-turn-helix transcriptional regulator [Micromonospora sp. DT47]|uniref:MarR family winged helix-turn-helix transcriptional regulator n=1 Tax=Micromonospora sp. DT47 TaxID=3393431 RepID=UPI003CF9174B